MSQDVITTEAVENETESKKNQKPVFDLGSSIDLDGNTIVCDENGRLTGVPANYSTDYRPLKRASFSTSKLHLEFKIACEKVSFENAKVRHEATVEALQTKIDEIGKPKDPNKMKLRRLAKMEEQMEKIKAELREAGMLEE